MFSARYRLRYNSMQYEILILILMQLFYAFVLICVSNNYVNREIKLNISEKWLNIFIFCKLLTNGNKRLQG